MKIKTLRIRNMQSIKDLTIEFDEYGVFKLDGNNNIGKSVIAKAIEALVKNVSNNAYKSLLRDDCTFFSVEYMGWDGGYVKLSRGSVDFYEWRLPNGAEGRADKTAGKVPEVVESYFNLYHEKEKTGEILNIRMVDSPLLFAATTSGDNYYILQRALGTEEFLLAMKEAERLKSAEAKEIKVIETYQTQEEERLGQVNAELAKERRVLQEVERYENVLKMESEIYGLLTELNTLHEDFTRQSTELEGIKGKLMEVNTAEVEEEVELLENLKSLEETFMEVAELSQLKKESQKKVEGLKVNELEESLTTLQLLNGLKKEMEDVSRLMQDLKQKKVVLDEAGEWGDVENTLTVVKELKELAVEYTALSSMIKDLKSAKEKEEKAKRIFNDYKKQLGTCPLCGGDFAHDHEHVS